ncbi:MAG: hypothetical protein RIQ33_2294 [Bacteroidota bacterium]|jgi:hypothetical protein
MTDIERIAFIKELKHYKEAFNKNAAEAKSFLMEVGIITKKGNLTKPYKDLCIQPSQA